MDQPTGKFDFNLRAVFAVMAIVAIVISYPSIVKTFGAWSPLVGILLFALISVVATGRRSA